MKKLFLSIALVLAVVVATSASEKEPITKSTTLAVNVNSFCKLIQMGEYDAVKALIEDGENVNRKSTGLTPLMFAARHNKCEIAKLLIANGAKLKTKADRNGFTALKFAKLSNAKECYKVIKSALEKEKQLKKQK
jgi:ankyrin repeat protein